MRFLSTNTPVSNRQRERPATETLLSGVFWQFDKNRPSRRTATAAISAVLSGAVLVGLLTGCADPATSAPGGENNPSNRPGGNPSDDNQTAATGSFPTATDYDRLLAELRSALAAAESLSVTEREAYEARIEALEAALIALGGAVPETVGDHTVDPPTGSGAPSETASLPGKLPDTLPPEPNTAETTPSPETGAGFCYRVENGVAVITGLSPTAQEARVVTIPGTIDGYTVSRIGDNAFAGTGVRSVTLPTSVTHIGWFAFYGCTALETVVLPGSVEHIAYGAFDICPSVTVYCPRGSYAAAYAQSFGIAYVMA